MFKSVSHKRAFVSFHASQSLSLSPRIFFLPPSLPPSLASSYFSQFHAALLSLKWSEFSRFMDLWSRRPFEIPLDENGKPQFTVTKAAEAKKGYHAILVNRNKKHHQERLVQKHGGVPLPKPSKKDKRKAAKKNEDGEDDEENVDTKDEEDEADAPSKSKLVSASSSTTTVAGNVAMRIKLAEEATKGKKNLAALMAEFASDE